MKPITIESFTEFQFVSQPGFSPDGSMIAFIVQHACLKDNNYKGDLYLYSRKTGKSVRMTALQDVKSYVWTEENTLLFASAKAEKKENTTIVYEISPEMGEAVKKFELPVAGASLTAAGKGRYLVTARTKLEGKAACDKAYEIIDEIPFWENGRNFTNGFRTSLFIYDSASAELKMITDETAEIGQVSVRGDKVLYKAYPWTDIRNVNNGIYVYDMTTGENRCVLEKDARRTGMIAFWSDDEALVASGLENPYGNSKYMDFYTMNLTTGEFKLLTEYDYSSGAGSVGSDARLGGGRTSKAGEGKAYFVSTVGYSAVLRMIDQSGKITDVSAKTGSVDSFDVCGEDVVVCALYGDNLAELYLNGEQITFMNDMSQYDVRPREQYTFTASDGFELTGWVMKPAGYEEGKKYPAIFHIHGGPRTVFSDVFHHEMQMWANAGYFVFFTNPRGSDGFGTEFGFINGKYGTVDYQNLMDFTDFVLEQYPMIDPARVGVTGGSYGGYMTNWIIGHTDRFAAAASQRSIANWVSFEYMSDIGHFFTKDNQSVFACEDVDKLWEHSPIQYIANAKTPTLFVHADQDIRCNMAEGMQMFSALKVLGVETRMLLVHGESHELSRSGKPRNRVIRMKEIVGWMDSHLMTAKEAE